MFLYINEKHFKERFECVLSDVNWAYERGLYFSTVALEYLEYNIRLFEVSKLEDFGDRGHSSKIIPFIFHSETVMRERANKIRYSFEKKRA